MNNLTPHDEYCDLFTASEFVDLNKAGAILPYDGSGYWATESGFSYDHDCFKAKPDWATHIAWYNK